MSLGPVVVTGIDQPVGAAVAVRLAAGDTATTVLGVSAGPPPALPGVESVTVTPSHRALLGLLADRRIATVVHAQRPSSGRRAVPGGAHAHVIATMRWAAAAAAAHREARVRRFIMVSSAAVYPASSRAPLFHGEHDTLRPVPGSTAEPLLEAEQFARDLASANPHLAVAVLRLAELAGKGQADGLASLLARPIVPTAWGFDPQVHLLHVDDAVAAIEHAAHGGLAGIYNVAGAGTIRWRQAAQVAGRTALDVPPVGGLVAVLLRVNRVAALGDDGFDLLRFGRCLDTDAIGRAGFRPTYTSEQCAAEFRGMTISWPRRHLSRSHPGTAANASLPA